MIEHSRSLTIHFSEEELELWEHLQSLPQGQRDSVMKEALQAYLHKEFPSRATSDIEDLETSEGDGVVQNWGLDALFVAQEKKFPNDPLQHLFQLIGEEEDADLFEYLELAKEERKLTEGNGFTEGEDGEEVGEESGENTFTLEDLILIPSQEKGPVPKPESVNSTGLQFLLQQVIGEEEDEEVLEFFTNRTLEDKGNSSVCEKLSLDDK